jgi:23S rRNA (guanosine2251-2'-O)-methyltransferase
MGRNCVTELIRRSPERVREVFLSEARDDSRSHGNDRRRSMLEEIERLDISVREVSRRDLDSMVQSDSHQGVVARVLPRPMLEFDELVRIVREEPSARILALDGVLDPQNFGAMLRAAECFGVTAVVWSKNRGAPLGPVVSKVSVGGSELVRLCPVSNLHRALEALKEAGAWSVGAMVAPDASPLVGNGLRGRRGSAPHREDPRFPPIHTDVWADRFFERLAGDRGIAPCGIEPA